MRCCDKKSGVLPHRKDHALIAEKERQHAEAAATYKALEVPILVELRSVGYSLNSLDELRRSKQRYNSAIPILLKWLAIVSDLSLKEAIVRTLSVPWAKPEASEPLIREFVQAPSFASHLKWAIGNALEVLADESVFEELMSLSRQKEHGIARQMIVLALAKIKNPSAVSNLIDLLSDEDVCGHAISALGKLGASTATRFIAEFQNHPKAWIRKEARNALAKISKSSNAGKPG